MVENIDLDREGGNNRDYHTYGVKNLKKLQEDTELIDIWRHRHPNKKQYTWFN